MVYLVFLLCATSVRQQAEAARVDNVDNVLHGFFTLSISKKSPNLF